MVVVHLIVNVHGKNHSVEYIFTGQRTQNRVFWRYLMHHCIHPMYHSYYSPNYTTQCLIKCKHSLSIFSWLCRLWKTKFFICWNGWVALQIYNTVSTQRVSFGVTDTKYVIRDASLPFKKKQRHSSSIISIAGVWTNRL